jgi:hypothetical protein
MSANIIRSSVLWEENFGKEWKVKIPFDGTKTFGLHGSARVTEESGSYFIELELEGNRVKQELGNLCLPIGVGIFNLVICIGNLDLPRGFDVVVKACIGVDIGPINFGECVVLYKQHITLHRLSVEQMLSLNGFLISNEMKSNKVLAMDQLTLAVPTEISMENYEQVLSLSRK